MTIIIILKYFALIERSINRFLLFEKQFQSKYI